jgi:hypothetical protein
MLDPEPDHGQKQPGRQLQLILQSRRINRSLYVISWGTSGISPTWMVRSAMIVRADPEAVNTTLREPKRIQHDLLRGRHELERQHSGVSPETSWSAATASGPISLPAASSASSRAPRPTSSASRRAPAALLALARASARPPSRVSWRGAARVVSRTARQLLQRHQVVILGGSCVFRQRLQIAFAIMMAPAKCWSSSVCSASCSFSAARARAASSP